MTHIRFREHGGAEHLVEAVDGESVMRAAVNAGVPGLMAECGGNLTCSTCHGYINADHLARLPPPSRDERDLLEGAIDPQPNSRLTCQLVVTPELDGVTVTWPVSQY